MGNSTKYLPNCTIDDIRREFSSIAFPAPHTITKLSVGAEYHEVFRLTFSLTAYGEILEKIGRIPAPIDQAFDSNSTTDAITEKNTSLILRVSGSHVPKIKTDNEIGILTYLARHTTIPVPQIIHYDASTSNNLQHEYMIMTLLQGLTGSKIYPVLAPDQVSYILDQLAAICLELYRLDFTHIGGLRPNFDTNTTTFPQQLLDQPLIPGPPIMETMWQSPDISKYFNQSLLADSSNQPSLEHQTLQTLNAISRTGYKSYASWLAAQMHIYIHAIHAHPSLHWVLDKDPSLQALTTFTTTLETSTSLQSKLNSVPLKLAHRDLHFGNILLSLENSEPQSPCHYKITGILDWEFAAILPFPLWRHSFLRDGISFDPTIHTDTTAAEFHARSSQARDKLFGQWARKVGAMQDGKQMLKDAKWQCTEQAKAWDVVNYLRCVVEVYPRGVQKDDAREWWEEVVKALSVFEIKVGG